MKRILLICIACLTGPTYGDPTMSVTIDAHHGTHNSLVACIRGALESWDRPADYAYIAGLSGIAFSPVYDEGEDCRAWWMEGGDDIRLDFLGKALGFSVETLTVPDGVEDWEPHASIDDMPSPRAEHLRRLQAAVERGDVVLAKTWPSWCVLTGWNDDLTQIPFETVPGFGDLVARAWGPNRTALALILSPAEPTISRDDAIRQALEFGTTIADGSFDQERLHYGGRLYQAAAERLDHDPFCVPCGDQSWSCAHRTLSRMAGTAGSAADFLEKVDLSMAAAPYRAIQKAAKEIKGDQLKEGWDKPEFMMDMKQTFNRFYELHREATAALVHAR